MKIDPGFLNHWKTERLLDQLGAEGVVAVLRLWGRAQINRAWKGLALNPKRLAMETKWKGDENHLFDILTDKDAPWLDKDDDGTFSIHDYEIHQKQVIHLWKAGAEGGRPKTKKEEKTLPPTLPLTLLGSEMETICKPNGSNEVESVQFASPDMAALKSRINALKPEWSKPAHWNHSEDRLLFEGTAGQMAELTDSDWKVIGRFLNAKSLDQKDFWRPNNRSMFVKCFPDVFSTAQRWANQNGRAPSRTPQQLPPKQFVPVDRAALAEVFGNSKP